MRLVTFLSKNDVKGSSGAVLWFGIPTFCMLMHVLAMKCSVGFGV